MKYSFPIKKADDDTEYFHLKIDCLQWMCKTIINGAYFNGNVFEVEIKKYLSKIIIEYPIDELIECEIKMEELFDIISPGLNGRNNLKLKILYL